MPSNNRKRKKSIPQRFDKKIDDNIKSRIDKKSLKPIKEKPLKPINIDNGKGSNCLEQCDNTGEWVHPSEDANKFCRWFLDVESECIDKCKNDKDFNLQVIESLYISCNKCLPQNLCTTKNIFPDIDYTKPPNEIELISPPDIEITSKLLSDGKLKIDINNNILFPITGLQFKISNIDFGLTDEIIQSISDLNDSDGDVNIREFVVKRGKGGFLIMMNTSLNSTTNKNITISFNQSQYTVLKYKSDICVNNIIVVDSDGDRFNGNIVGNCNDTSVKDVKV